MTMPFFTGTCTALITPFLNGKINYRMLELLLDRQMAAGIGTIVLCGTTGESPTLSDKEKMSIFCHAKEYVGNGCTIIAGTGSNDTQHAVSLSRSAEEAGADALLVVSPYYNKASCEGLCIHYSAIAASVHIPIILYNVPSRTGLDIPVSVYRKLSGFDNIVGVKEASGDIKKTLQIMNACPDSFSVWSGNDNMTVPIMSLGGTGVISVVSNICPMETQAMTQAALAGDFDTAAAIQIKLMELTDMLFSEVNPIPVKEAMKIMGYDCGECRLPLTSASKELKDKLKEILDN